jgi:heme-degrading monooxygenase HmoA
MLMEFTNPLPGREEDFEKDSAQRMQSVLALPGWIAAQRLRAADTPGRPGSDKPRYLTIWEVEGTSAQAIHATLTKAIETGAVRKNAAADDSTAEIVYWEPISPHITKDDFER